MAEAEVGDDVFGEDPTVRALEERSAELLGAEAGLLVSSGTMGNLVGLMAHVPRGGEIIGPADIHTFSSEAAGHAVIAGASVRMIPWADDGTMDLADVRAAVRDPNDVHEPITSMLTIENSHALSMGQPLPPAYVASVADVAREIGVPLFIDGARLFNASVALGVPARDLVPPGASATFCLSKSLACPVGSLVVGDASFIERARRARKLVGGGMRQAGSSRRPGSSPCAMARTAPSNASPTTTTTPGVSPMPSPRCRASVARPVPGADQLRAVRRRRRDRWPDDTRGATRAPDPGGVPDRAPRPRRRMIEYPKGLIRAIPHYGIERADIDAAIVASRAALAAIGSAPAVPA